LDLNEKLEALVTAAERLGVRVRREPLGGEGGGLCELRGQRLLFIDTAADLATQCERTAAALAGLPQIEQCYLVPEIRVLIERYRNGREQADAPEEQANRHSR